jgi:2-methylcitrate dehydratase PrpD
MNRLGAQRLLGRRIAGVLTRSWRPEPPAPDFSAEELESVSDRLFETGAAPLAWWRIKGDAALTSTPIGLQLHDAYRIGILDTAIHERRISDVLARLTEAGIDPIIIKGWDAARLYPVPGLRPCGDIDLCVLPGQIAAARDLVEDLRWDQCQVDLSHKTIDPKTVEHLFGRSAKVKLGSTEIRILAAEDRLRVLSLHLLTHSVSRALWLCDIAAAVEAAPEGFDWDLCLCGNDQERDRVACVVRLAQVVLGADITRAPARVRERQLPSWLVAAVLERWAQPWPGSRPPLLWSLRPREVIRAVAARWPDPIASTMYLDKSFNNLPRLPVQAIAFHRQTSPVRFFRRYLEGKPTGSSGTSNGSNSTRALVRAVRDIRWEEIPDDAREVARHCLLDFLGIALAGSREPLTEILISQIVNGEGSLQDTLIGRKERAGRLNAALVNGSAGHALDFDDGHMTMNGHPSVPVIPAILALAEGEHNSGRALLEALVVGIELECRLAALLGLKHYELGFHSTGTIGTFGAAAACAHLMRLDEDGWLRALGLAGTQAAGLRSGFGTMAKPLHAGRAASAGLLSALLARGGFTADTQILEADQGFAATHAGLPLQQVPDRYAGRFLIRNTLFKDYPACYGTHAPIQAAAQIRDEPQFSAQAIEHVEVRVSPALLGVCNILEPRTGLEGKFSLRATVAMELLGVNTSDVRAFTDEKMTEVPLVALRDRIRVVAAEGLQSTRAKVIIVQSDGRRFEAEADCGMPVANLVSQRKRLTRKFMALASSVIGQAPAQALASAALQADQLETVGDLMLLAKGS